MSSCVLVAISGACDFDNRLARGGFGSRGPCPRGRWTRGLPGTNSGASPANDPSADAGVAVVKLPPNARPFIIICEPPLSPRARIPLLSPLSACCWRPVVGCGSEFASTEVSGASPVRCGPELAGPPRLPLLPLPLFERRCVGRGSPASGATGIEMTDIEVSAASVFWRRTPSTAAPPRFPPRPRRFRWRGGRLGPSVGGASTEAMID